MRRALAILFVLLGAASEAAVRTDYIKLGMPDPMNCLGVDVTIGTQTFALVAPASVNTYGPISQPLVEGSTVSVNLKWVQHDPCMSATSVLCHGSISLTAGSGTACTNETDSTYSRLTYVVTQVDIGGGVSDWSITFSGLHTPTD